MKNKFYLCSRIKPLKIKDMNQKIKKIERAADIICNLSIGFLFAGFVCMFIAWAILTPGTPSPAAQILNYCFGFSCVACFALLAVWDHLMGRASNLRDIERRAAWNKRYNK